MKKLVFGLIILFSLPIFSQTEKEFSDLTKNTLHNKIRLNHTLVHMPVNKVNAFNNLKPTMGLIGLHYNIPLNNWLYVGAGMHAAVTGDQGGLFTLGVNLGVNKQLYKNIYFDANLHFGGGGGYRYLVNGGAILYPNIGLQYKKKDYSFGIQYGSVDFLSGIIKSDNLSFFIEIPSTLNATNYKNAQRKFEINNTLTDAVWTKPAVKNMQLVTFDFLFPIAMSRRSKAENYNPITNTLYLLGFEYQRYITKNTFVYLHTDAMYKGLTAGFMDLFIGVGKNFYESKNLNFFGKFGLGAAGGRIYPEGGLTMYPSIGAAIKLSDNFGISTHTGYHRAIGGSFEAYTAGISLKYFGLNGGTKHPFKDKKLSNIKIQGIQLGLQNQTYINVAKVDANATDLQLISLKVNYNINKNYYLSGEASFAYEGKSGGYAQGLFGIGIKTSNFLHNKFSGFAELTSGVAGGAGVDTGEGILIKPVLGFNYHVNNNFSFNLSGGQLIAPFGNINSTNINIGITYGLSILNIKK